MKNIENRGDVNKLVSEFYIIIRKDNMLGPIFNHHLTDEQWPTHIEKLTDFWVTNLFGEVCFKGNPSKAHIEVDKYLNHGMNQNHFNRWLQLWAATIDSLFIGALAKRAKEASERMAIGQFAYVYKNRPEHCKF